MNSRTKQFLEFFKGLNREKTAVNALLKAENNRAFAYYIAPIENIDRMYQRGGILPRKYVISSVDVSSNSVQELRNKEVLFSWSNVSVDLHKCVNLFLNPINDTLYHFRRNALIQKGTNIGILEIDLESALSQTRTDWEIFPGNFIKNSSNSQIGYESFPWSNIYTIPTKQNRNQNQAAEIIVRNALNLIPIRNDDISRVIVLRDDLISRPIEFGYPLEIIDNPNHYGTLEEPLDYDRYFLSNLFSITNHGVLLDSVISSLLRLATIEDEIGMRLIDSYKNQAVATGPRHGISHTIRVMFWVLFLSSRVLMNNRMAITEEEVTASLYAAFIHDLCRTNDQVDSDHGNYAANNFIYELWDKLEKSYLERCLNAAKVHSLSQDPEQRDVVWYLLKDADAIDRSRFGSPGEETGCQKQYLRLKILKQDDNFTDGTLWTSFYLSRMTKYINWKDYSCKEFVVTILGSLQALINSQNTPPAHKTLASRIVQGVRES